MLDANLEEDLAKFLVVAKRRTYAGLDDDATIDNPLLAGSMQLEFHDQDWMYRDIYQGMSFFTGIETVYFKQNPVWAMSYSGGALHNITADDTRHIYAFLRSALMLVSEELPFRGPLEHTMDDTSYRMDIDGALARFKGVEEVLIADSCKYQLSFAGGLIQ